MANLNESLADLTTIIETYLDDVKTLMDSKVGKVEHVLSSKLINGMSYTAFLDSTLTDLRAHEVKKGNVHNETPSQYNMLTNNEFNIEIDKRTRRDYFPIARWGNLSYLPAPVSGSFEGGVHIQEDGAGYIDQEYYNLCLEDDGTLTFIRNATNGRQRGVYYGYITNALDKITRPILTGQRYTLPGCTVPVDLIYRGGEGAVIGQLQGNYNGGHYFLALMSGTLDCNQHRWVVLDEKYYEILRWSNAVVEGNTVWIIETVKNNYAWGENPIQYRYWKFVFKDHVNGTKVELEQIKVKEQRGLANTDLSSKGVDGAYVVSDAVFSWSRKEESILIRAYKNGYCYFETGPSGHGLHRQTTAVKDGVFKTLFEMSIRSWSPKYSQDWWTIYFTFYFDTNTGKAYLQDTSWKGYDCNMNADSRPVLEGNLPQVHSAAMVAFSLNDWNNPPMGMFYDNDRVYWSKTGWAYFTAIGYTRYSDSKPLWDRLDCNNPPVGIDWPSTGDIWPSIASPIGPRLNGFTPLGNGWALTRARDANGTNHNVVYRYDETGKNVTNRTFTDSEGNIRNGFKLNTERYYLSDIPGAISDNETMGLISIVNGNDVKVRASYWVGNGGYERQPTECTDHLVGSNYRTVSKDRLKDRANELKQKFGYAADAEVFWEFIVLGLDSNTGYLFVSVRKSDHTKGGLYGARVNIQTNSSTYDINDLRDWFKVAEDTPGSWMWTSQSNWGDPFSSINAKFYLYRVDSENGWLLCWNPAFHFEYNIGTPQAIRTATVKGFLNDNGTMEFSPTNQNAFWENGWTDRADPRGTVFPGLGIGMAVCETVWTTNTFRPVAQNKEEAMGGWGYKRTPVTLANMEVAEGFTLYFTEKAPCVMHTTYYEIDPISIDLKTIKSDPSNTSFLVFVRSNDMEDTPHYEIVPEESMNQSTMATSYDTSVKNGTAIYIGRVTCGPTQIERIDIRKTTTLNGFTLSTQPAGNAIPVSTGNPDAPNSLSWV